ncbi:glycoside hydrolase [Schizopora paradoxa]|uniref:Glycoside hydrolase n=1 Tax=Schizopora paradoxa TaxID=27342 RepID=A0A0H2SDM0_9AGAM|nr:glycoside hydrolase [Schizopora paradoxa]
MCLCAFYGRQHIHDYCQPYTLENWRSNIKLAAESGIDGFVLNVGKEDWQLDRVADCFAACKFFGGQSPSRFKLMISFDMSSIPSSRSEHVDCLVEYLSSFGHHQSYYRIGGRCVVSTFAGEACLFGHAGLHAAWKHVLASLNSVHPVCFIPSFFLSPDQIKEVELLDGYFNWNGCWPVHLSPDSPQEEIRVPSLNSDGHFIRHMRGRRYMASVSPWFFTHYGEDSWNKNWIYRSDDWLYVRRWEQLVSLRNSIDIVQIISWNDYGESHYIGPVDGAQPNSQAWVDGFDHTAWLKLTKFFAVAFKTGIYPAIDEERIFAWARPHSKDAVATRDYVPRPDNWQLTEDLFWVVIFAKAPSTVSLWSLDEFPRSFEINAGVSKLHCPLLDGGSMHVEMCRGASEVACLHTSDFTFTSRPEIYNFNAYVATSP